MLEILPFYVHTCILTLTLFCPFWSLIMVRQPPRWLKPFHLKLKLMWRKQTLAEYGQCYTACCWGSEVWWIWIKNWQLNLSSQDTWNKNTGNICRHVRHIYVSMSRMSYRDCQSWFTWQSTAFFCKPVLDTKWHFKIVVRCHGFHWWLLCWVSFAKHHENLSLTVPPQCQSPPPKNKPYSGILKGQWW